MVMIVALSTCLTGCLDNPCPDRGRSRGAAPPRGHEQWRELGRVRHGPYTRWFTGGSAALAEQGSYREGKRDGLWTHWHESGDKAEEHTWRSGQRHGPFRRWSSQEQLVEEGGMSQGRKHGVWRRWDTSGALTMVEAWRHDELTKSSTYTEGREVRRVLYRDGHIQQSTVWHASGEWSVHERREGVWHRSTRWQAAGEGAPARRVSLKEALDDGRRRVVRWADGRKVHAEVLRGDERSGVATRWHANGNRLEEGYWEQGQRHGRWSWWYPDGLTQRQEHWKGGLKHGLARTWHDNGHKATEGDWEAGKAQGTWRRWDSEGRALERQEMQMGQAHGLVQRWHTNGTLAEQGSYVAGEPDGLWERWSRDGRLIERAHWRQGRLHGSFEAWFEDGGRRAVGEWTDGQPSGAWRRWSAQSAKVSRRSFDEGEGRLVAWRSWYAESARKADGKSDGVELPHDQGVKSAGDSQHGGITRGTESFWRRYEDLLSEMP